MVCCVFSRLLKQIQGTETYKFFWALAFKHPPAGSRDVVCNTSWFLRMDPFFHPVFASYPGPVTVAFKAASRAEPDRSPGAGFWPLAGCQANQPLPKMWEAKRSRRFSRVFVCVCFRRLPLLNISLWSF